MSEKKEQKSVKIVLGSMEMGRRTDAETVPFVFFCFAFVLKSRSSFASDNVTFSS